MQFYQLRMHFITYAKQSGKQVIGISLSYCSDQL